MSRTRTHRAGLRRTVVVATILALALLCAAPASATSDGQYVLDTDAVELDALGSPVAFGSGTLDPQTGYSRPGQLSWYRNAATGRLRGELLGTLSVRSGQCGHVRAVWRFGNNTEQTTYSTSVCGQTTSPVALEPLVTRDALRVRIELHRYTPGASTTQLVGARDYRVMEGASGDGTCARVDDDPITLHIAAGALFTGRVRYLCDVTGGNQLRARIIGTLTWNNALGENVARLSVRWIRADGGSNVQHSAFVSASQPSTPVILTSPALVADVMSMTGTVLAGATPTTATTPLAAGKSQLGRD